MLRYLARHGGRLTGREIARVTGSAWARTSEALKDMVAAGLLIHRRVGRAIEYRLNEDHYLIRDILLPAFQAERHWPQALGQEVARLGGSEVLSVILYGSVARGVPRVSSDLDLAVVVWPQADPAAVEARLSEHYSGLDGRYARPVSFLVMDALDFRRRVRRGDRLAKAILADGRVLAGMEIPDLLVAHRQRQERRGRRRRGQAQAAR